jgi:hypothetical protein
MVYFRVLLFLISTQVFALNPPAGLNGFFEDIHNLTITFYDIGGNFHNVSMSIVDFLHFVENSNISEQLTSLADLPAAMRYSADTLNTAFNGVQIAFYVMAGCYIVHAGLNFIPKVWAYCANKNPYAVD